MDPTLYLRHNELREKWRFLLDININRAMGDLSTEIEAGTGDAAEILKRVDDLARALVGTTSVVRLNEELIARVAR